MFDNSMISANFIVKPSYEVKATLLKANQVILVKIQSKIRDKCKYNLIKETLRSLLSFKLTKLAMEEVVAGGEGTIAITNLNASSVASFDIWSTCASKGLTCIFNG